MVFDLKPTIGACIEHAANLTQNKQGTLKDAGRTGVGSGERASYMLERENLVGMKSHSMAAAEDSNYLLYAFATEWRPCASSHWRAQQAGFGNVVNLIYFNKNNGAYRKKECLKLIGHKITHLKFSATP